MAKTNAMTVNLKDLSLRPIFEEKHSVRILSLSHFLKWDLGSYHDEKNALEYPSDL